MQCGQRKKFRPRSAHFFQQPADVVIGLPHLQYPTDVRVSILVLGR